MPSIEIGRICVKTAGRDTGKFCVVTKIMDDNFIEITGPKKMNGVKRKRCGINHVEATGLKLEIKKDSSDESILGQIKKQKGLEKKIKEGLKINENK